MSSARLAGSPGRRRSRRAADRAAERASRARRVHGAPHGARHGCRRQRRSGALPAAVAARTRPGRRRPASRAGSAPAGRSAPTPSSTSTVSPRLRPSVTGLQAHAAVVVDDGDARALAAEQQRIGRHVERAARRQRQRDLHVGARQQRAVAVRQRRSRPASCASPRRSTPRCARPCPRSCWPRSSACVTTTGWPGLDQLRIRLRHVDVDAQRVGLRQHEQRGRLPPPASIRSPTSTLRRVMTPANGATTRLKPCELAQALHVGVGRGQVGARLREAAAPLVELLLRDDVLLAQRLPALDRALRQLEARPRSAARAATACDSCWSISGDLDLGQQLALLRRGCRCPWSSA